MRGRVILGVLTICAVLLSASIAALAIPSYLGPSGLILTPDAQANGKSGLAFSAHFFDLSGALASYGVDGETSVYAASYSPIPALEFGVSALDSNTSGGATLLNGKIVISDESSLQSFAFVGGVVDMLDQQEITPYLLVSKSFSLSGPLASNQIGLSVNAGYGGGFYSDGFIVGGELKLHPQFSIIAEGTKKYINLGARFSASGLALDVGLIDMEDIAGGVSYTWSLF